MVKVTQGQVVAAVLRTIAQQLVKLAQQLDDEAMAGSPVKQAEVGSMREYIKRLRGGHDITGKDR